jgi:hypothetical protein
MINLKDLERKLDDALSKESPETLTYFINEKRQKMEKEEIMVREKNPLNGHWLCWIPNTPYAYSLATEKQAKEFCSKFNQAFDVGKIKLDDYGRIVKVK